MLRFIEGFEGYGALNELTAGKWTTKSLSGVALDDTGNARGGRCLVLSQYNAWVRKSFGGYQADLTVGVRFQFSALPSVATSICDFQENSSYLYEQVRLYLRTDGTLLVTRGISTSSANVLCASTQVLAPNTWYYIELQTHFDNSAGTVVIRVDGETVASALGVDTIYSGSNTAYHFRLIQAIYNSTTYPPITLRFHDLYCCDGQAGVTGFQGDCRVETLRPTGAGSATDFTASGGSNYACVDETRFTYDTDYVESSTLNHQDTYAYQNLPSPLGKVVGVQVVNVARSDDGGARSIRALAKSGATTGTGATAALTQSYAQSAHIFETNPDTSSPWTRPEVDGAEFGVEVAA